ncbi:MAG: hypothetical protein EKK40_11225 [Bradyrhizobiaceae bacterium]|nr:MAG: hypothetical protein EKK40_11225 [Bradyrhizobiaceae bacterium]
MSDIISSEIPATAPAIEIGDMNRRSLDLVFNAQKAVLDEMILLNNTIFEHACGEIGVATELMSKLAEAHSVKAIMEVCEDCRKHQIDVLRRDNDCLFQYSKRFLDRTAGFLTNSTLEKVAA